MKKSLVLFQIYLIITLSIVFTLLLNPQNVSAETTTQDTASCCAKAKNGQSCVGGITQEQCEQGYSPVSCDNLNECKNRGCCKLDGNCVKGVLQGSCSGEYYNDAECNIGQCQPKCCVLGNGCSLMGEEKCQELGGTTNDAADIGSCNQVCESRSKGCCKSEEGCSYASGDNCGEEFFTNQACTRVSGCTCNNDNPTTACSGNDLYSYDSCGNPTLKERCDARAGSICGDKDGDGKYSCEDMNCKNTQDNPLVDENGDGVLNNDGNLRKNGESWCEYQSAVGLGLDLPGTSHYLHACINGKEEVQMCGEGNRNKICVYDNSEQTALNYIQDSRAMCIDNDYQECLSCNDENNLKEGETKADCCGKASLCSWIGLGEKSGITGSERVLGFNFLLPVNANINSEGVITLSGKKITSRLNDVKILFINKNDETELTKSLSEAVQTEKQKTGDKILYKYELKLNLEKTVTEIMDINISRKGKSEFLTVIEIEATIKQDGYCLPFVPPGNIAIKNIGANNALLTKAEEECALGDSRIATQWKREDFEDEWSCTKNCNTYPERSTAYINNQNFLCGTYGDCGAKWNILEKWGSEGYYFECGSSTGLKSKYEGKECSRKKYYLDTAPNEFNFTVFKYAGRGIVAELEGIDSFRKDPGLAVEGKIIYTYALAVLVANPVTLIIGGIAAYFELPLIWGDDVKRRHSSNNCDPWEPPLENECWRCHTYNNETKSGSTCDYLSGDCGLLPSSKNKNFALDGYECTRQMCASLGKDCLWQDSNLGARCIEQQDRDVISPKINVKEIKYECQDNCNINKEENSAGIQGATYVSGKIKPGNKITITLETRNPTNNDADLTRCRYTTDVTQEYQDMRTFDDGLAFEHTLELNSLEIGENNLYFACEDVSNNENEDRYLVKFDIGKYPDKTAPTIFQIKTITGYGDWNRNEGQKDSAYVIHNGSSINLQLMLDEQVNGCRWTDSSTNVDYGHMTNELVCNEPEDATQPYTCNSQIGTENENRIWFRCQDLEYNNNTQSIPIEGYRIKKSTELKLLEIKCLSENNEKCEGTIYDNQITLQLTTEGGTEGNANCKWNPGTGYVEFLEGEGTNLHKQPGINLKSGENKIEYTCVDKAGNKLNGDVQFKAEKDTSAPLILKIYQSENQLLINTNENSVCKYSFNKTFDFNTENTLSKDNNGIIHSINIDKDNKYFKIGCTDRYENKAGPFEVYVNK
ncbi:hypothetical protein J4476_05850 [Candidatus Woesearchaeota archaeon]|nr:MAG: hypothetical protein QT09_C0009G0003 [archaeon GW2011_AR18]MBS3162190.1 hypothetical protein [Candidatus Woesearchaeota archaeon]